MSDNTDATNETQATPPAAPDHSADMAELKTLVLKQAEQINALTAQVLADKVEQSTPAPADPPATPEPAPAPPPETAGAQVTPSPEVEQEIAALRAERARNALQAAAQQAGLRDLDYLRIVPQSAVTINEDGEVSGAAEAIADLKERHPLLFGDGAPPALSGGAPASSAQPATERTPEQQKFYDNFGWGAWGGKHRGADKVTHFDDAFLGEFKRRSLRQE